MVLKMSKDRPQLNMRLDDVTGEILKAVMERTEDKKSKVVRDALEYYASHVLGQEELLNIRLYRHYNKN